MRCHECHSYVPEGLPLPMPCPHCGKTLEAESKKTLQSESPNTNEETTDSPEPSFEKSTHPFAPFFTIQTKFSFGRIGTQAAPSRGSVSFGPEGFSLVYNEGKSWNKIYYRDLTKPPVLDDESLLLSIREVDSKIIFYPTGLGLQLPASAKRARAAIFLELLGRVRKGLTGDEIEYFKSKLS